MSFSDDDDFSNTKRYLHIAIEVHEDNKLTLPPEVIKRITVDPDYLQGVLIALLILQGSDPTQPACELDVDLPCGEPCACYNATIASSALEILMSGANKDDAIQFLFEEFITQFEKPSILH